MTPRRAASWWSWTSLVVASGLFWVAALGFPAGAAAEAPAGPARAIPGQEPADSSLDLHARLVQPFVRAWCIDCHGPDKTKADLRLDSRDEIDFGADSGPVLVPGSAKGSALIQVLHLPPAHDRHMPPDSKPQPPAEAIAALEWWVDAGAPARWDDAATLPDAVRAALPVLRDAAAARADESDRGADARGVDGNAASPFDALPELAPGEQVDPATVDFAADVQPLLQRYCFECHGPDKQKGSVRLDVLDPDIVHGPDAEGWHAALDMINGAEMPPDEAEQPSDAERRFLVGWLTGSLEEAAERKRGEARTVVRRLTKAQYTNTLQELLGLDVDFGRPLPDDAKSRTGFSNNGAVLQASPLHLETYQQIAREALEKAIVVGPQPEPVRYRVTFGKGRGAENPATTTGGFQSLPLPTDDFLLEILDRDGRVRATADDEEARRLRMVRNRISVGLRGSSRSRFRVVDDGMTLYGALPHREVPPGAWQGPSPNVKLELQRVFPDSGELRMRVRASRGELFSSDERVLIELPHDDALAFVREGRVVAPPEAHVFRATQAADPSNLRRDGAVLLPAAVPEPSQARFTLEIDQPGHFQIDLIHPPAPPDAMPSVRLGVQGATIDRRLTLSGAQLTADRIATGLGAAWLPAGEHALTIGGRFFVGFEQLIVTPIPPDHPAVTPLREHSAERAAELARKVPSLRAFAGTRTDDGMDYAEFDAPQEVHAPLGAPATYEFRARLENLPLPAPESGDTEILSGFSLFGVWNDHLVKSGSDPGPPLLVESIELEAPYHAQWPPASHTRIFFDAPALVDDQEAYGRAVIHRFLERAFRRPVGAAELDRYVGFWHAVRGDFEHFEHGVREVLVAALCSPRFLFLAEPAPDDWALASRLSYFLWNSPPDAALRRLAADGRLGEQLDAQVDRLLDDPRSRRFVEVFTEEWLRLDRHRLIGIDVGRYPAYTRFVKRDMAEETRRFFREVLVRDLPATTLLDADFALLNQNLAEFYGVDGVRGQAFRPVPVDAPERRGGLLTQGAFLAGHSDGRQPHPIKRAVWLKEKLLADAPPPPPPNVPDLDPEAPGFQNLTLKEQLERHRDNPSCHDCHAGIDPYGIAFERLDAVGRVADTRNGRPVDAHTVLPDGTEVDGVAGLKRWLLEEQHDHFLHALAEHLWAYALGRDPGFADEEEIAAVAAAARQDGATLRAVVRAVVHSPSFRMEAERRAGAAEPSGGREAGSGQRPIK